MIRVIATQLFFDIKYASKKNKILLFVAALVCILQLIRIFFGVDTGDESYYFTQVVRFIQGDRPFADSWDVIQTQGIFLIPLYYVYTLIFKYEGLILFGRLLFFVLSLVTASFFYYVASKDFGKRLSVCTALIILVYAPFSLYTIGYNQLMYLLGFLGMLVYHIGASAFDEKKYSSSAKRFLFVAGILHAAMVASYPTMVVILPFVITLLLYYAHNIKGKNTKLAVKLIVWYIMGLLCIAMLLVIYILVFVGLKPFLFSIEHMLDYNSTTHAITIKIYIDKFIIVLTEYIFANQYMRITFIVLCAFSVAILLKPIVLRIFPLQENKNNYLRSAFFLVMVLFGGIFIMYEHSLWGYCVFLACISICGAFLLRGYVYQIAMVYAIIWLSGCIVYAIINLDGEVLDNLLTIDIMTYVVCLLPITLFLPSKIGGIKHKWFCLIAVISLMQTCIVCYTSGGYWYQGRHALLGTAIFVVVIFGMQIKEHFDFLGRDKAGGYSEKNKIIPTLLALLMVASLLIGQYLDVYGDNNNLSQLDTRISKGPGRGIYTSTSNAILLDSITADMHKYSIERGRLLVLETFPYSYGICPNMRTFTQNTWAATLYTKGGYTEEIYKAPIFDYMDYKGEEPDVIFYFGKAEFLENPDPNYKMHQYIIDNYISVKSSDNYTIFHKKHESNELKRRNTDD